MRSNDSADDLARLAQEVLASLRPDAGPRSRNAAPAGDVEIFDESTGWFSIEELTAGDSATAADEPATPRLRRLG